MALHTRTHSTHTHTGTCTPTCMQLNTPSQSCSVSCQANVLNENFLTKITSINQLTCKQHTCRHTHAHTHTVHTPIQLESAAFHTYLYAPWPASCVLCPRTVIANFAHVSSTSFAKLKVKTCPKLLPPFLFLSPSFSLSLFPTYSKFLAYQRNTSASQDVCQLPDAFALVSCEIN